MGVVVLGVVVLWGICHGGNYPGIIVLEVIIVLGGNCPGGNCPDTVCSGYKLLTLNMVLYVKPM